MLGTSTADQVVYAVASTSVSLLNGSIPLFIDLGGVLLAIFAALAIFYAVVYAGRSALNL